MISQAARANIVIILIKLITITGQKSQNKLHESFPHLFQYDNFYKKLSKVNKWIIFATKIVVEFSIIYERLKKKKKTECWLFKSWVLIILWFTVYPIKYVNLQSRGKSYPIFISKHFNSCNFGIIKFDII